MGQGLTDGRTVDTIKGAGGTQAESGRILKIFVPERGSATPIYPSIHQFIRCGLERVINTMEEDPPWALKARRMSGIKNAADEERRKKEEEERTKKEEEEKKRLAEEKRKQRDDWTKRASTNMGKVDIDKKIKETKLCKPALCFFLFLHLST